MAGGGSGAGNRQAEVGHRGGERREWPTQGQARAGRVVEDAPHQLQPLRPAIPRNISQGAYQPRSWPGQLRRQEWPRSEKKAPGKKNLLEKGKTFFLPAELSLFSEETKKRTLLLPLH